MGRGLSFVALALVPVMFVISCLILGGVCFSGLASALSLAMGMFGVADAGPIPGILAFCWLCLYPPVVGILLWRKTK